MDSEKGVRISHEHLRLSKAASGRPDDSLTYDDNSNYHSQSKRHGNLGIR